MAKKDLIKITAKNITGRSSYRRAGIGFGIEPISLEVTPEQLDQLMADDKGIKVLSADNSDEKESGK